MANRKINKSQSHQNKVAMDSDYEIKRQKNNDAVKRSRQKAKEKSRKIAENIKKFKEENKSLEEKKKLLKKELEMLKDMFMAYGSTESNQQGNELVKLLLTND